MLDLMAATRTQVYLTDDQRKAIDAMAEVEGVTMAEIVRRALDMYIQEWRPDPSDALRATFGSVAEIAPPSRDEWGRG